MSAIYSEFLPLCSSIEFKTIKSIHMSKVDPPLSGATSDIYVFFMVYEIIVKSKSVICLMLKFQRILSHGSQLEGKKLLWFLYAMPLKGAYQFYLL